MNLETFKLSTFFFSFSVKQDCDTKQGRLQEYVQGVRRDFSEQNCFVNLVSSLVINISSVTSGAHFIMDIFKQLIRHAIVGERENSTTFSGS